MHKMLNEIEGVSCYEPEGAFYCFPNFTGVIGREIAGTRITDTLTLTDVALTEAHASRWCRVTASGRRGTCGSVTRSVTTTSSRASRRVAELLS